MINVKHVGFSRKSYCTYSVINVQIKMFVDSCMQENIIMVCRHYKSYYEKYDPMRSEVEARELS